MWKLFNFFSIYSTLLFFIKPTVLSKKHYQFKLWLLILDTIFDNILLSTFILDNILLSAKTASNGHLTATWSYYKYTQSLEVKCAKIKVFLPWHFLWLQYLFIFDHTFFITIGNHFLKFKTGKQRLHVKGDHLVIIWDLGQSRVLFFLKTF